MVKNTTVTLQSLKNNIMSDWKNDKEYWIKRENKLPLDVDTKSLRILVDKII